VGVCEATVEPATAGRSTWVVLAAVTALWLARWPLFPAALDPAYHLMVAREMVEAGGLLTHEWWQAAPQGRPHLYPPLIHLILAGIMKAGCDPVTAIRLLSVTIVPAQLLTIVLVMRRVFGPSAALASLLMALLPFSWLAQASSALAAAVASILILWLLAAVVERRWRAVTCLAGLLFYTHLAMPGVAVASVGAACAMGAVRSHRRLWAAMAAGVALGLPWLWHVFAHTGQLHLAPRQENQAVEIVPALWALAAIGAWRCVRTGGTPRLLVGLWLGYGLLVYPYTYRWLSGEGLLPLILLAGIGLAGVSGTGERHAQPACAGWRSLILAAACAALLPAMAIERGLTDESRGDHHGAPELSAAPASSAVGAGADGLADRQGERGRPSFSIRWLAWRSAPFRLLAWSGAGGREDLVYGPLIEELAETVASLSRPREILWSNAPYALGLVAAIAHRPTSTAMLYEVPARGAFDPVAAAHLIVWFKMAPLPGTPRLDEIVARYRLEPAGEHALALLLRNPAAAVTARAPLASLSWKAAFVLLCGLLAMSVWDFLRVQTRRGMEGT
jgi:hypothetical protein